MKVIRESEVHRLGSTTFIEVFKQRNPTIILGLSATFNRLDGKHELLNKYCPPCDFITTKEAIENNWLSQYKEYKVIIEADDIDSYKEYSRQFQEAFSVFNFDFNVAMKCLTNIIYRRYYAKTLGITPKDIDAIVFTWNRMLKARKDYIMNHPKKIEITRKILAHRQDKKAITFSATIKQAEKIGGGLVVHSGNTKKKNRTSIAEFAKVKTGTIHSSMSMNEGIDCPGLNLAIVLCGSSSPTVKTQRVGRVIRYEEGKEAEIFSLVLKSTVEESWFLNSNTGKSYMEITEAELDDVLKYKPIDNLIEDGKEIDVLFRL